VVKPLKGVTAERELVFRIAIGKMDIIQISDGLVPVLNPYVSTKRASIISQPHPEPNLLPETGGIRKHLQVFNKERAHTNLG
jgi:hypothetical protein